MILDKFCTMITPYKKNPLSLLLAILVLTLTFSCGEEGIGFNVSKEFPVDVPISIDIPDPDVDPGALDLINDLLNVNPPSETIDYNLNEVGAFDDALDGLGDEESIQVNGLFYEILDVSANEEVNLDELSITVNIAGSDLTLLDITSRLTNVEKTAISLTEAQRSSIIGELRQSERISSSVVFDLSEIPADNSDLEFTFRMYFDVTLRARDL